MTLRLRWFIAFGMCAAMLGSVVAASAQTFEIVGVRALGMGGAFVAAPGDAEDTWWNPAALAAGPLVDIAAGVTGDHAGWGVLMTPPVGVSVYRFRVTDIASNGSTVSAAPDREQGRVGVPTSSLSATQIGATLVQSLASGVHVGGTVKYVRGAVVGSDGSNAVDADLGGLVVTKALRVGAVVRNLTSPEFGTGALRVELPREARLGVAYDGEAIGRAPLVLSMDADLTRIETTTGDRRNIAVGVERWLRGKTIGLRGGARFNTVGREEKVVAGGASVAVKGLYLEGYVAGGSESDDNEWGVGARMTF